MPPTFVLVSRATTAAPWQPAIQGCLEASTFPDEFTAIEAANIMIFLDRWGPAEWGVISRDVYEAVNIVLGVLDWREGV